MNISFRRGRSGLRRDLSRFAAALALAVAAWLGSSLSALPEIITWTSGSLSTGIPDSDPTGYSTTHTVSAASFSSISEVKVYLDIAGGYNGDLYAYLEHDGILSVLLNRVGTTGGNSFGYADAGLRVTLADSAGNGDIHLYQQLPDYQTRISDASYFQPDGRNQDPRVLSPDALRTAMLSQFIGQDPNGDWTLFVADVSGGEAPTLAGWGLEISGSAVAAVPEPDQWMGMGLCLLGAGALACRRRIVKYC